MSVALESAAGTFAVVGVADVLVRTGRELYSFLRDIKDAPKDLARLQEVIQETVTLHQVSIRCQKKLEARPDIDPGTGAVHALISASRALHRALQSLRQLIGRFQGAKTWARIKFVLSESKVQKTISNLEQTKALLANALTLACCELTELGDAQVETYIRGQFQKARVEISEMLQSLDNNLKIHHRTLLKANQVSQQVLISRIQGCQKRISAKQDAHQRTLASVQQTQTNVLQRQDMIARLVSHTHKQNTAVMRTLKDANSNSKKISTSSIIPVRLGRPTDLVEQGGSIDGGDERAKCGGRDIFFLGERQEQFMAYLLLLQDDLNFAIDYIISQHRADVLPDDAEWLRSELEHLIGSASQENAMRYANFTATSMDQWHYPEDIIGYLRSAVTRRKPTPSGKSLSASRKHGSDKPKRPLRKCGDNPQRTWSVTTESGNINIMLPDHRGAMTKPNVCNEARISCTIARSRSAVQIRARFLRHLNYASQPRIHVQLNSFVVLNDDSWRAYGSLLKSGTLQEIDSALRRGTISPCHLGGYGDNLLLWHVAYNGRVDVLDYLETQGIGQSALNHDPSLLAPLSLRARYETKLLIVKATLNTADVPTFVIRTILLCIADCDTEDRETFLQCLGLLYEDVLEKTEKEELLDCFPHRDLSQNCASASRLVALLVSVGISVIDDAFCTCFVWRCLMNRAAAWYNDEDYIEMLRMLIDAGAHVDFAGADGVSTSMFARLYESWDIWCRALARTGRRVQEVVSQEGNAWLLEADWRKVWRKQQYTWHDLLPRDEVDINACQNTTDKGQHGESTCSSRRTCDQEDAMALAVEKSQIARARRIQEEMNKSTQLGGRGDRVLGNTPGSYLCCRQQQEAISSNPAPLPSLRESPNPDAEYADVTTLLTRTSPKEGPSPRLVVTYNRRCEPQAEFSRLVHWVRASS